MSAVNKSMKVIELVQAGEAFDLQCAERQVPQLGANELLVAIDYVALNHVDARLAQTGFSQWQYPHVLGLDAVGTVVDAPKGVFPNKGSRVLFNACLSQQGMLKEYAVVPSHSVSVIPDEVPSEVAVSLPNAGMAALIALNKLQLQSGESLLINSAQGAVAHFAIQYAKQQGAQVYAFAQKPHQKRLEKLGADLAFDCEQEGVCEQIKREIGNAGFDCIINTQGGETFLEDLQHLRFCGRIACLNGFSTIPEQLLFEKAPNIGVVSVSGAWLSNSLCAQQHLRFMGEQLLQDVAQKRIQAPELNIIDFEVAAVRDALSMLLTQTCTKRPIIKIR